VASEPAAEAGGQDGAGATAAKGEEEEEGEEGLFVIKSRAEPVLYLSMGADGQLRAAEKISSGGGGGGCDASGAGSGVERDAPPLTPAVEAWRRLIVNPGGGGSVADTVAGGGGGSGFPSSALEPGDLMERAVAAAASGRFEREGYVELRRLVPAPACASALRLINHHLGEPFMRVRWVAVPEALRAWRVNRLRGLAPVRARPARPRRRVPRR
jgi:hypothetical protein